MIYLVLIVVGLSLGSFVNALVWRLHAQAELAGRKKRPSQSESDRLSITKGRSMCMHCKHELAAKDLVPVLSWVYLRGRCRYCRAPIDDTPVAELLVATLLVLSYLSWPLGTERDASFIVLFGLWSLVVTGLVALAIYDSKWFLLPDRIVWPVTWLAAAFALVHALAVGDIARMIWALGGGATLSGIFWLMSKVSKGTWIGWGDVKLGLSLGIIAGSPLMALLVLFIASVSGTLVTVPQILRGQEGLRTSLPFGPHLIAAAVLVFLYGSSIFQWYMGLLAA